MEEGAARRKDNNKDDKRRSKESGGWICHLGWKTGGLVGCLMPLCSLLGDGNNGGSDGGSGRWAAAVAEGGGKEPIMTK